jgi:hypothetical protein
VVIVVFEVHRSDVAPQPYYVKESVGIAVGFLLAALHHSGFATLTHMPSTMRFLNEILGRPREERAYVVISVGKSSFGCAGCRHREESHRRRHYVDRQSVSERLIATRIVE